MRKILLTFLTYSTFHFAFADICFTTFEKDSANADIIFVGKVIDVNYGAYWNGGSLGGSYAFEVVESFKGLTKWQNVISIISPVRGCCSPHFKLDSTFLVFAFSDNDHSNIYWTNDCTLTDLLSEPYTQEYYARLGEPIKPVDGKEIQRFKERKAWLLEDEIKKMDSVNLAFSNLQLSLKKEQRTNTYLTISLIVLVIISLLMTVQRIRSKKST